MEFPPGIHVVCDGNSMAPEPGPAATSFSFPLGDGPANALALSKDNSHVVVAGRNVFKILEIEEDGFIEKVNLRVGKNLNLNYSCNDVVWSTLDENLIATGATNGAVVLWNLSKQTRAKQEHVFSDHQRTVHKVLFHPTDPFILLSGSQDGTVKWFDLRAKEARLTFRSNSESVRDVEFVPRSTSAFASVSENGVVQLWDVRKGGERPTLTFTAHHGPVFSCDWHPESTSLVLATGGRDRAIKVWTVTAAATLEHTIQTVASVGRIKWRPQRKNHIGSTSLVVDASVCVWDVRRPFVPFAAFEKHRDVATGICWRGSPHVFLSTSKDCTVWQHVFRDASRPASKAIPQALAINGRGNEVVQALVADRPPWSTRSWTGGRKSATLEEQFHLANSHLFTFETTEKSRDVFRVELATGYTLDRSRPAEACERNGQLASDLSLDSVSLVWDIARLVSTSLVEKTACKGTDQVLTIPPKDEEDALSDDELNNSSSETEKQDLLNEIASGLHMEQNLYPPHSTYDFQVSHEGDMLPAEAFQPRHAIREGSSPPPHHGLEDCSPRDEALETVAVENKTTKLKISRLDSPPAFDFCGPLAEALTWHAARGDVQTAVSVSLVLADSVQLPIQPLILEGWASAYVELLQRFRLFTQAALVVKNSGLLGHLSQQSTSFLLACGTCGKPLAHKTGNYCEKCMKVVARCGVCHGPVKGLMGWCQGCGHGGHVPHLDLWFSDHDECPVGCGHLCRAES